MRLFVLFIYVQLTNNCNLSNVNNWKLQDKNFGKLMKNTTLATRKNFLKKQKTKKTVETEIDR